MVGKVIAAHLFVASFPGSPRGKPESKATCLRVGVKLRAGLVDSLWEGSAGKSFLHPKTQRSLAFRSCCALFQ